MSDWEDGWGSSFPDEQQKWRAWAYERQRAREESARMMTNSSAYVVAAGVGVLLSVAAVLVLSLIGKLN